MSNELLNELTFFVLSIFVGIEVISKVPTILHTPLMSGNPVGGFVVTDRMLEMFKGRSAQRPSTPTKESTPTK